MRTLATLLVTVSFAAAADHRTALDRYIAAPDPSYKYSLVKTTEAAAYTAYVLDMTSQSWRKPDEVDRTLWQHWVTIVVPKKVESSTGFLFITGGGNDGKPPARPDGMLVAMARNTNSVTAEIRMVPNQPLKFPGESEGRKEDSFIAYTWDKFLHTGDENWPARLPMTKSAVRAMDAVTSFCASDQGGKLKVDKFVVAGGSKRGWTTWTTAAADQRVVAIAPFVIDMLNLEKSMEHHFRAYGFWAPAVGDYARMGLMKWAGTPQYRALLSIVEPYAYRDRLTLPKYLVNACGDQYFLPDSSQFYWDDLAGEKHLRYVPNADHSLKNSDARESLAGYYHLLIAGKPRPRYGWKFEKDGSISLRTEDKPSAVKLWQATNPAARDFRLETLGPAWKASDLEPTQPGVYSARVQKPEKGWTAFLLEMTFPVEGAPAMKVTSGVRVVPDVLPYPAPPAATAAERATLYP